MRNIRAACKYLITLAVLLAILTNSVDALVTEVQGEDNVAPAGPSDVSPLPDPAVPASSLQPGSASSVPSIPAPSSRSPDAPAPKKKSGDTVIRSKIEVMPTLPLDGLYAMNDGNVTCVLIKAGVRFTFTYPNVSANDQTLKEAHVDLAVHNFTVEGHCLRHQQRISIIFSPVLDSQLLTWNLTLNFDRNKSDTNHVYASMVSLQYSLQTGSPPLPFAPHVKQARAHYTGSTVLSARQDSSFLCMSKISLTNFTSTSAAAAAAATDTAVVQQAAVQLLSMRMYGLQLQAFRNVNNTLFSDIIVQCEADSVRFTVPYIVGVLLLVLILTVLVFFIIRRRGEDRKEKYSEVSH
jgi:hypothetical protein